jgi:DnaK suppressor protein
MALTSTTHEDLYVKFGERLRAVRRDLVERLAADTDRHDELTATHGHGETELAVRDGQRSVDAALRTDAVAALDAIDEALARLDSGSYGTCVSCGDAIPIERLSAIPEAARCVGCQQRAHSDR